MSSPHMHGGRAALWNRNQTPSSTSNIQVALETRWFWAVNQPDNEKCPHGTAAEAQDHINGANEVEM